MNMSELVREIEIKRKALDVEAGKNIWTPECYQMSLQLDKLIETYMQCKEEVQLQRERLNEATTEQGGAHGRWRFQGERQS